MLILTKQAGPLLFWPAALTAAGLLSACGSSGASNSTENTKPSWLGTVTQKSYDGRSDDLLTAGLGKSGLSGTVPTYADPLNPTAAELRRTAIYYNYRALVDMTTTGGYGSLYGPNIDINGQDTLGEGMVAGEEYLAFADDGSGQQNVTLMVQLPASFNRASPCVVTATSPGSRGVYGAIAASGEWGLKHGCAVAYTDKGGGVGVHDLMSDTVNLIDGTRSARQTAGKKANFASALAGADLAAFNAAYPGRQAVKHAHSGQNPEKNWGRDTLRAVEFAFWVLNEKYGGKTASGKRLADYALPGKVLVIASSVSNGAGSALRAVEADTKGLISAVAVSEPQIQPDDMTGLAIVQGGRPQSAIGKSLIDYFTAANLYQPCAAQSPNLAGSGSAYPVALNTATATDRCASLAAKGLVSGATLSDRSTDAYNKLLAAGWTPDADALHASHYGLGATLGVALTYANAYGRFAVSDNLCGYSFAFTGTGGVVIAPPADRLAGIYGTANGVPPTGGISVINNLSYGGALADPVSVSPSTQLADYNIDGAICLRKLATGVDPVTGAALTGNEKLLADRVAQGVSEVKATGRLHGVPGIIVAGRSDALIPVNHGARAYYALNQQRDGAASRLRYIEVTHAQHFDGFLSLPGFPTRFIPLHVYGQRALDAVWAFMKNGAPLPQSQVVRTTVRSSSGETLTAANLPAPVASPAAAEAIVFRNGRLNVPD
ncbi:3-hydroxybutyrate oligomer hydrolase family protein [Paludibacterium paludis]|uniref:D-(-)-3-hydroxybutyrate oligomer hydrolase n=1 Tax=Paludibacterium paludis TaxID=1225769 RepID=A0A918P489_9NEIS|nr:3-hydroxybutyrate oligomer hydrolase family protein [Paludibacterium paludis]GGY18325.1 D-(-)-3-hydroxybutyrate oligomer hydrolase [Paludibacterium paludis]